MTKKTEIQETKRNPLIKKVANLVELEKQQKALKEQIDTIRGELLDVMQKQDVLQLKTGTYTLTKAQRITPQVVNFSQLKASLDFANIPYDTEETFTPQMNITFKQAIKEGRQLDGLEAKTTEYVSIRIN